MRCPWGISHIQWTLYWFLLLLWWVSSGEWHKINVTLSTALIKLKIKVENYLALLLFQFVGGGTVLRSWRYNLFLLFWSQNLNISFLHWCNLQSSTTPRTKITILAAWGHNNNFLSKHILTFALLKKTALCCDVYRACISQTTIFKSLFFCYSTVRKVSKKLLNISAHKS